MGQRVTACRVSVPSVLYVRGESWDAPASPPDISLAFQAVGATATEEDWYYLTVGEAEEAAAWLMAAASDPSLGHPPEGGAAVIRETYGSVGDLDRWRITLHGERLPQANE